MNAEGLRTERVERLEAVIPKSVSVSNAEVPENKGDTMPADGLRTERVVLEIVMPVDFLDPQKWAWHSMLRGTVCESVRVVDECCLDRINMGELIRQRDAAIRERDEARAECERLKLLAELRDAERTVASEVAAKANAESSAKLAAAANAGGEPQPPRGLITKEERDAVRWIIDFARHHAVPSAAVAHCHFETAEALLARSTPPRVKVPRDVPSHRRRDDQWIAAIREAGGEVCDE